jgi:hypothetical protein
MRRKLHRVHYVIGGLLAVAVSLFVQNHHLPAMLVSLVASSLAVYAVYRDW